MKRQQVVSLLGIWAAVMLVGAGTLWSQATRSTTPALDTAAISQKIVKYIRERFSLPETVKLQTGAFRNSPYADFYVTTVTMDDGQGGKKTQDFYVSKNGRYLIDGTIFTLGVDPKREVLQTISLRDVPTEGPANAPVTIVEFADPQCSACAVFHELLVTQVLPKYPGKVRVVFKEFPLSVHDWALTGSIANQCVYQINPHAYVPFRSAVFQHQASLTAANARDALIMYGEQLGLDRLRLATCIDSKATLPRIERDVREGSKLGINRTPSSFINGKLVTGAASAADVIKAIEEALFATQK